MPVIPVRILMDAHVANHFHHLRESPGVIDGGMPAVFLEPPDLVDLEEGGRINAGH